MEDVTGNFFDTGPFHGAPNDNIGFKIVDEMQKFTHTMTKINTLQIKKGENLQ